ncbi:MAG: hypothetical protein LBH47_01575 [Christensenellaceae bacterium]|jgi:hypothetical protein|nr:hypothetical protein [Christensenellaceae bacterium]
MEVVNSIPKKKSWIKRSWEVLFGSKGRKVMLLTGLLALLVVTGYLNFRLNEDATGINANASDSETNLFQSYASTRQDARASRQLILENLLATSQNETTIANAEAELAALAAEIKFETDSEYQLKLTCQDIFDDVVVSKNGLNINVLVKTGDALETDEMLRICQTLKDVNNGELNLSNVFISEID